MIPREPAPAGFGACGQCAFLEAGTPAICGHCLALHVEHPNDNACKTCQHPCNAADDCKNPICAWPDRAFEWCAAVAYYKGPLAQAIRRYKFDEVKGWARIFGRVLANRLQRDKDKFDSFDLIVANPTFVGKGGRSWDHVRLFFDRVAVESGPDFPFDHGEKRAIIKTRATTSMAGKKWAQRKKIAEDEIYPALAVPTPDLVAGKRILVVDDLFTDGQTLRMVATALNDAGAASVCGLALARAVYGG